MKTVVTLSRVAVRNETGKPSTFRASSALRTPLGLVVIVYYLLIIGLCLFIATSSPLVALYAGGLSIAAGTALWAVCHRLYVPRRLEVLSDAIVYETRATGSRLLPAAEFTLKVSRAWRFGALLTYASKDSATRLRSVFMTQEQTEYVLSHGLELLAR